MQPASLPQQGGYVRPILLPDIIIGILFAVGITYTESIPLKFQKAADNFLGRVTMFIIILGLAVSGKWIIGLLAVIFALRLMRYDATVGITESFIGEQIITKVEKDGDKWFVEDVLEEKPKKIEEKIIETQAVQ
jgi:hypothetical protein